MGREGVADAETASSSIVFFCSCDLLCFSSYCDANAHPLSTERLSSAGGKFLRSGRSTYVRARADVSSEPCGPKFFPFVVRAPLNFLWACVTRTSFLGRQPSREREMLAQYNEDEMRHFQTSQASAWRFFSVPSA